MEHGLTEVIATPDGAVRGLLGLPDVLVPGAPLLLCVHGGGCNARYFDLKGFSMTRAATRLGAAVLAVHRPGHSGSALAAGETVASGASATRALLEAQLAARPGLRDRPIVLIGHSIGGAIALAMAADGTGVPVAGVCVSGIGDVPAPEAMAAIRAFPETSALEMDASFFFGPDGTYDWRGPLALRAATELWRSEEVDDIMRGWRERWPRIVASISVPVYLRLAGHEHIWEASDYALQRMRRAFTSAPAVDAAILPDGGHLYEIHHGGREHISNQVAWAFHVSALSVGNKK